MSFGYGFVTALASTLLGASLSCAETLQTHRIRAALAVEATVDVVDADGATLAAVRGDGAGIHTLD
jgi:uncharacterized protein GlcG (DUF336 family)